MSSTSATRWKGGRGRASRASFFLALVARTNCAQPVVRPHPVIVAVGPIRLQRVISDRHNAGELEGSRRVARLRAHRHAAEKIGLARASRAWTRAAKLFERIV